MTFTELEIVLLSSVIILLLVIRDLRKKYNSLDAGANMMLAIIVDVTDNGAQLYRTDKGQIGVKPKQSTENHNGTSN